MVRHQRILYLIVLEQYAARACVLGQDEVCLLEHPYGAEGHVLEVTHRCGHHIESSVSHCESSSLYMFVSLRTNPMDWYSPLAATRLGFEVRYTVSMPLSLQSSSARSTSTRP